MITISSFSGRRKGMYADWTVSSLMCCGIEFSASSSPPLPTPKSSRPSALQRSNFGFCCIVGTIEISHFSVLLLNIYHHLPLQGCFTLFFSPIYPLNLQQYQQHNGSFVHRMILFLHCPVVVAHCSIIGIASQTAKDRMQLQQRQSQYLLERLNTEAIRMQQSSSSSSMVHIICSCPQVDTTMMRQML